MSLEAVVAPSTSASGQGQQPRALTVCTVASERIIVRASNPGQFEQDVGGGGGVGSSVGAAAADGATSNGAGSVSSAPNASAWRSEPGGDGVYHLGRVGINTDRPTEALTVNGNIQLMGQIRQPSDLRIKGQIQELDPRKQLENVNRIKIVKYKYRPEFVQHLPEEQRKGE